MLYSKKIGLSLVAVILFIATHAQQTQFSLATDLSVLRNLTKDQKFWSIGQTVNFHFHFTPKDGAYAWFSYYSDGKFTNPVTATAKSPSTSPQTVNYFNRSAVGINHISLGWKRYLKGRSNLERGLNIYGYAGFGLMMSKVTNTPTELVDTAMYVIPVQSGTGRFKRLTFDVGLGLEVAVGADVYMYTEVRTLIPTTDYPSSYLLVNDNAPFPIIANLGFRILLY